MTVHEQLVYIRELLDQEEWRDLSVAPFTWFELGFDATECGKWKACLGYGMVDAADWISEASNDMSVVLQATIDQLRSGENLALNRRS